MKPIIRKTKKLWAYMLVFAIAFTAIPPIYSESVAAATKLSITESSGWLESAYAEWTPVDGAVGYTAYVKKASESDAAYVQLDSELIRQYSGYWRADALGLSAGNYIMTITAVLKDGNTVSASTGTLKVQAHDRSGFAFSGKSTFGTASGAYNDDGTLKEGIRFIFNSSDN